jgi:hypothetical protein
MALLGAFAKFMVLLGSGDLQANSQEWRKSVKNSLW